MRLEKGEQGAYYHGNRKLCYISAMKALSVILTLLAVSGCEGFLTKDYDHRGFAVTVDASDGCYVEIHKDTTRGGPGGSAKQPPAAKLYH